MPDLHDAGISPRKCHYQLDRLDGRREPDALQPAAGERVERARLSARCAPRLSSANGVNLVDDHRARRLQHLPGFFRR